MDIKLKLAEVINIYQTLKIIIDDGEEINSLFKFKLLGIMKCIEPTIANFEIIRNEKIIKYGKETKDGNIQIPKDDTDAIEKFNKDISELINSEVSINIQKLKVSDIFNKGVKAEYLVGLYPIIEE